MINFSFELSNKNKLFSLLTIFFISIHPLYSLLDFILLLVGNGLPVGIMPFYFLATIWLAFLTINYGIRVKDVLLLCIIYFFFIIQYFLANDHSKIFFRSPDVTTMFMFYIPVGILGVSRVTDWTEIFTNKLVLWGSDLLIFGLFVSKLSGLNLTNYMSFSYSLLPFWGIVFLSATLFQNKSQWLFVAVALIEGLVYGARGTLLWYLFFMFYILFFNKASNKFVLIRIKRLIILFFSGLIVINILLPILVSSKIVNDSYFLRRIAMGSLTDDAGRGNLAIVSREVLAKMSIFQTNSVFYDRTVLPNGLYAHSIVYELLLDFGWIIGSIFLLMLLYVIIRPFITRSEITRTYYMFFIFSFFARYFISGSIFDEGMFWIFIGTMVSLNDSRYEDILNLSDTLGKSKVIHHKIVLCWK
ncbi:TPA: hypothetical protein ACGOR2_001901 [Streptococcus suis]